MGVRGGWGGGDGGAVLTEEEIDALEAEVVVLEEELAVLQGKKKLKPKEKDRVAELEADVGQRREAIEVAAAAAAAAALREAEAAEGDGDVLPPAEGEVTVSDVERGEEPSVHSRWLVACYIQPETSSGETKKATGAAGGAGGVETKGGEGKGGGASPGGAVEPLLNLEISTTVKQPELVASKMRIDFGQIAVGQAHVEELRVKNMSPTPMMLETVSPHTVGPYSVLNAARPLAADGGSMVLKVQFAPLKQLKFFEKLHLRTDNESSCNKLFVQ